MSAKELLEIMSHGQFVSGVKLASQLGVSRTTIWKQFNELKEKGIEFEKVRGKGYRMLGGGSVLRGEWLKSALAMSEAGSQLQFEVVQSIDSTNSRLVDSSGSWDENKYYVLAAESQTKGRGRRGKQWFTPYGKNICFSLGFVFTGNIEKLEGLSVVVGVILADVLCEYGVNDVSLKWPNDVYVAGKKLGGILIELTGEFNSRCAVVIGVGLNVDVDGREGFTIDQLWTSLRLEGYAIDRTDLLLSFIQRLVDGVGKFLNSGSATYFNQWESYDYLRGKLVEVHGRNVIGVASGLKENGCLILKVNGCDYVLNSGEVSVRLSDG
ncbi:MAG: biotin--[acetyl-CoA-carboxylase] ligase [Hahellaceae bacterium]|nr:biotin--[acetyl-CoA-carboxylase] ligase [Hahellaceae bacterium]MCP5210478.1 biotin--[acetyl-CoA-carboxylase] ligase [Hahellaceae bacterium]